MKHFIPLFSFLFCTISAQKVSPLDSLKFQDTQDFFADDYGNIYLYKNRDFSFTKYDSVGKQLGKMMMTLPFRVQNVQNPLNIVLFSENAQEMKFIDQNLNEIQKIDFSQKFAFIKMAYAEDLQQIWLLDESMKRLVQYNFRDDHIINSYPLELDFDQILDIIIFEDKLYLLTQKLFSVYNFKGEKLFEKKLDDGRKLRRENNFIYIISKKSISKYHFPKDIKKVFNAENSIIVDKNTPSYFEIRGNKLYLYSIKNSTTSQ